jgi:hypothetical protein
MLVTVHRRDLLITVPVQLPGDGKDLYLKYQFATLKSGEVIVVVFNNNKETERLNYQWTKLKKSSFRIYTRTPSIMMPFVGKQFEQCIETNTPYDGEIFRMIPDGFIINQGTIEYAERKNPYFSPNGMLILPGIFVRDNLTEEMIKVRISFAQNTSANVSQGYVFAYFTNERDQQRMTYPVHAYHKGLKTRQMKQFVKFLYELGRLPTDFIFGAIKSVEGFTFPVMMFGLAKKEGINVTGGGA